MSSGDTYRHLSAQCQLRSYRLLLRSNAKGKKASKLHSLEVHDKDEGLIVMVKLAQHETLDSAAAVALAALEKRGAL